MRIRVLICADAERVLEPAANMGLQSLLFPIIVRWRSGSRISPGAYIKAPSLIAIGRRSKVHVGAMLDASGGPGIVIGDGVTINRFALVQGARGGVQIGDGSEINNFSVINGAGGVRIGRDVLIGPHVSIVSHGHTYADAHLPIKRQPYRYGAVVIEDDVWIGAGAVVLAGVTLGTGSVVAAGAVVTRSCAPHSILKGVPARAAGTRR